MITVYVHDSFLSNFLALIFKHLQIFFKRIQSGRIFIICFVCIMLKKLTEEMYNDCMNQQESYESVVSLQIQND